MNQQRVSSAIRLSIPLLGAAFLLYFGVLLYSECGQAGQSWRNLERKRYVQATILLAAAAFISRRPADPRAQVGALFLAAVGTAPLFPHEEMRTVWRELPAALGAILWIPQFTHFMILPLFLTFHAMLPRPFFRGRWRWILVWLPALLACGWGVNGLYQRVYHPPYPHDPPGWYLFIVGLTVLLYGFGGLAALLVNYLRLRTPKDRRRMRVITFGSIIGWAPVFLFLAAIFWGPLTTSRFIWALVVPPYRTFCLAMFALIPICLTYALFRDRILDIDYNESPSQQDLKQAQTLNSAS